MKYRKQLVFIGGFPSGGTDLLKSVLNAHPNIYINGEMPFLYNLNKYGIDKNFKIKSREDFNKIDTIVRSYDIWSNVENIDGLDFESCRNFKLEDYFYRSFSEKKRGIWGNKTPQNTENIVKLRELFHGSKFIVIVRDIRDICLSVKSKWGKSTLLAAHKWASRMDMDFSDDIFLVKYEDLLKDIEKSTRSICLFLDIDWNKKFLSHHEFVSTIIDGKINYGKSLYSINFNKWKSNMSSRDIKRIEEIAFNTLKKMGYTISLAKNSVPITGLEKRAGTFRDMMATILVGNRTSKHNSILDRVVFTYNQLKIRI